MSSLVKELNTIEEVLTTVSSCKNVLFEIWAPWCGPCKIMAPQIDEIAEAHTEIEFIKVNAETISTVADTYSVQQVPTIILYKDGVEVARTSGFKNKGAIEKLLKDNF